MRSLLGASSHRRSRVPRRLWAASALALLLVLVQASPAAAESPADPASAPERARVILLVRTPGDDGVMTRVRAELVASSWRIVELRPDESASRVPLARVAAQQDVRAAVRLDPASASVELWIEGRSGDIEETLSSGEDHGDDPVIAYRITEALRARGLKLEPDAAPPSASEDGAAKAAAPRAAAAPAAPPQAPGTKPGAQSKEQTAEASAALATTNASTGLWLGAGPALDAGVGGLGPAFAGWLGVRLAFAPRWSVGAFAAIPLVPQSVSASEGSARVSNTLLGAVFEADFLTAQSFRASAGLGASYAMSSMRGDAATGYLGVEDTVTALVPFARATGNVALSRRFWLSAGVLAGAAFPEVSVEFADQPRATWGRPVLVASLTLEVLLTKMSGR